MKNAFGQAADDAKNRCLPWLPMFRNRYCRGECPQALVEYFGGRGKGLVFFRDHIKAHRQFRADGPEYKVSSHGVDEPVQTQSVSDAVLHQIGGIVNQIVGRNHIQGILPEPVQILMAGKGLVCQNHRKRFQLIDIDRVLPGERTVLPASAVRKHLFDVDSGNRIFPAAPGPAEVPCRRALCQSGP